MGARVERARALRDPVVWIASAAALLVAASAWTHARLYRWNVIDDSYISFQYAKNLATGHGVVFNPGERVEGYTNFLWVVVLAPLYAATRALSVDFTRAAIGLNVALAVVDLLLVAAIARRMFSGRVLPVAVAVGLTALDGSYQAYAASGMENHLFTLFLLLALYADLAATTRRPLALGAALAGLCMTRPDGVLFALAYGLAALVHAWRGRRTSSAWRALGEPVRSAAVFAALFGAYFAWRLSYYGDLLPNTFYLKVGDTLGALDRGLDYTRSFVEDRAWLPLLAAFALLGAGSPLVVWLASYVAVQAAYVTYVGGDFYSGHRYYVAILPLVYLLVATTVDLVAASPRVRERLPGKAWAGAPAVVSAALAGLWLVVFVERGYERGPYTQEVVRWAREVDNNVRYMRWMNRPRPEAASMVVGDIGASGFFGDLRVIDVFGVIDPVVAHMRPPGFGRGKAGHEKIASRAHVLAKDPTFIKWGYIGDDDPPRGYYLFTEFPDTLRVPGLWVKEDLRGGELLPETAIHFDRAEMSGWEATGTAFASTPDDARIPGQARVVGHVGSLVNTFTAKDGDRATGRLVSPPFALVGDRMLLRVGGGRDRERLRVSLLVDGERMFSATGHEHEILGRRVFEIDRLKGKMARLEIVDEAEGRWGHLLVDEIVQWRLNPGQVMPTVFR